MTNFNTQFGCGEFIPGQKPRLDPPPKRPVPRKIIPINRRTPTIPPMPGGGEYEYIDPRSPNPGNPGRPGGGTGTPVPPGNGGPTTPGPGAVPPGSAGGSPTPVGPSTPGPGGPGIPTPTGPSTPGPGGPGIPTPTGPSTPGPGGPGTPGPLGPLDDPPRRRRPGADLTFAINPTVRLDDEEEPGGGGPTLTFGEALTLSLEDSNNNSNPDVENFPTIGLEDAGGGGGLIQESNAGNFGSIASQNFPSPKTSKTYDLRDNSTRSEFSKFFTGSNLYDPVYNILKHNAAPSEFVQNTKYRNIFSSRITKEVDYLLSRLNNNSNWEERFITGLTTEKLSLSLNSILREAFDTILDVNGLALSRNYFLSKVLNHLIKGTLNEFNPDYYINLADSIAKKQSTSITQTVDQQVQKNNILGIMYNNSKPIDYSKYSDFSKIDMARMRFLLTDIESNFYVETIDGTEYQLELRDAGAPVDYATFPEQESLGVSSDYVPPGEGDGYYYKIEDENSNLNALVLNTQIDKAYYVTADTRQLALGMLGRDPSYKITASSTLINSEFSSGYYEQYTASAIYLKLDLASIESIPTSDSLVEDITASYRVLTDADETQDHAKTYGGRVAVYHVQYDDPFFQYASRSGKITLNMQDITLRNFAPKRTSTNKIVVRNLPDGLVIYPVSATEDNPTGAYSDLDSMGDVVARSLYGQISFDNESSDLTRAALTETLIAEAESAYSYGLVGLADTQNYYYTFTPSSFPNSFAVTGRGPAGNLVYNVVNSIKQKYDFTYLTWWDLYRRLSLKDFSTLIFNLPDLVVTNLYQGWLGFPVKDVLNQFGESLNNLTDISPDTSDVVYLDGRSRGNV